MDYYINGAVEEYLKHNRTILEGLRDQGVFSQEDVESELENIKAKIEKDIETNKACDEGRVYGWNLFGGDRVCVFAT